MSELSATLNNEIHLTCILNPSLHLTCTLNNIIIAPRNLYGGSPIDREEEYGEL